jgi:hypothetical protein
MAIKLNVPKEAREMMLELEAHGVKRDFITTVPDGTSAETRALLERGLLALGEGRSVSPADLAAYNDACNRKYLAKLTTEIRQGYTGADFGEPSSGASNAGSRYEQGSANDPTASLRDDDDDPDFICDDFDCSDKDHERAAVTHRNAARNADNWQRCAAQHKAADRHDARRQENLSQGERMK